ncbi:MAG: hypothetical protein LBE13_02115 [Bacteroidales bacterium]|jgi:hypothetical protein|nr:hypothetical protein [Bacteroidales bacterium]
MRFFYVTIIILFCFDFQIFASEYIIDESSDDVPFSARISSGNISSIIDYCDVIVLGDSISFGDLVKFNGRFSNSSGFDYVLISIPSRLDGCSYRLSLNKVSGYSDGSLSYRNCFCEVQSDGSFDLVSLFVNNTSGVFLSGKTYLIYTYVFCNNPMTFDFCLSFDFSYGSSRLDDPDDSEGDGDGDDYLVDGENENENKCECGACCSDKCTCGLWTGKWCTPFSSASDGSLGGGSSYKCFHDCPGAGCSHVAFPNNYTHCECHHEDLDLSDYGPPTDPWTPGDLTTFSYDFPDIPDVPPATAPGLVDGSNFGGVILPNSPDLVLPDKNFDSELNFFTRNGSDFPTLDINAIYLMFKNKLTSKLHFDEIDWASSTDEIDLVMHFDFELLNTKFGPLDINISDYINQVASYSIVSIIRAILLFILVFCFLSFVLRLLFV